MAEIGSLKYSQLVIFLSQGCSRVLKALITEQVNKNCSQVPEEQRLDAFLYNKQSILFPPGSHQNRQEKIFHSILYPGFMQNTKFKEWDLQLVIFVVQRVGHFPSTFSMDMMELKRLRNAICHTSNATLTDYDFDVYMGKTRTIFKRSLGYLTDQTTVKELQNIFDALEVETKKDIYRESLLGLNEWYRYDKLGMEQKLTFLQNGQQKILERLDELFKKIEEIPNTKLNVKLPEQEIVINVKNCPPDQQNAVSQALIALLESKIRNDEALKKVMTEECFGKLKQKVEETVNELALDGLHISNVMYGCVVLSIRCNIYTDIRKLWMSSADGILTKMFDGVQEVLRVYFFPDVEIDVSIAEIDWLRCVSGIEKAIGNALEKKRVSTYERQSEKICSSIRAATTTFMENEMQIHLKIQKLENPRKLENLFSKTLLEIEDRLSKSLDLKTGPLDITVRGINRTGVITRKIGLKEDLFSQRMRKTSENLGSQLICSRRMTISTLRELADAYDRINKKNNIDVVFITILILVGSVMLTVGEFVIAAITAAAIAAYVFATDRDRTEFMELRIKFSEALAAVEADRTLGLKYLKMLDISKEVMTGVGGVASTVCKGVNIASDDRDADLVATATRVAKMPVGKEAKGNGITVQSILLPINIYGLTICPLDIYELSKFYIRIPKLTEELRQLANDLDDDFLELIDFVSKSYYLR